MAYPEYRLDFRIDSCFDAKQEIEFKMNDFSRIKLYPRENEETMRKGSLFFQDENLNETTAYKKGVTIINEFTDLLIISTRTEKMDAVEINKNVELTNPSASGGARGTGCINAALMLVLLARLLPLLLMTRQETWKN